jgi:ligand-binding sensor domain-containing protein/signal transduction histidine kinase
MISFIFIFAYRKIVCLHIQKNSFLCLFFCLLSLLSFAQNTKPKFQVLSIEHGLSQNIVTAMQTDAQGFLWIGTQKGLNRYDGYKMKPYFATENKPTALQADFVNCIYKTTKGNLWIGTKKGLSKYNPATDDFENFSPNIQNADFQVFAILEDKKQNLWLGTNNGLYKLSQDYKVFENYKPQQGATMEVQALFEDSKGNLWAGSTQGLAKFDRQDRRLLIAVPNINVKTIAEDQQGNLWAGCTSGLHTIDLADASAKKQHSYLANNSINALIVDSKNVLWIATNWGLFRLNRQQNRLELFNKTNHHLQSNYVNCLYEDEQKTLWIGTYSGLHFTSPYFRPIEHFRYEPMQPEGISNDTVTCLLQDKQGKIWVGTANGLNVYDSLSNEFFRYFQQTDKEYGLLDNQILSIFQDSKQNIWVGTGKALSCFDTETRKFEHFLTAEANYQIDGKQKNNGVPQITAITEDIEGNLWLGTMQGEVLRWESEKIETKLAHFQAVQSLLQADKLPKIQLLLADKQYIWIGTLGAGMFRLNTINQAVKQIFQFANHTENKAENEAKHNTETAVLQLKSADKHILSACVGEGNTLWFGTKNGLNLLNTKTLVIEKTYTEKDGLAANQVRGLVFDKQMLWLSTQMGISNLQPKTQKIKNFTVKDGLQGYEFNANVALKTTENTVYFGGNNGLNYFALAEMKENKQAPKTVITAFHCLNLTSNLDSQIVVKKQLELQPNQNSLFFEFAALNFVAPEENTYAYFLEGFDTEWQYIGKRRFANYTNLPSGNYTFKVKAANNDGYWAAETTDIQFVIKAPFWQKLWFWVFVAFALLTGTYMYFQIRLRQQRKISRELEKQVALRTRELLEQKKEVEKMNQSLETVVQERTKALTETIAENENNLHELKQANLELDTFTYHASHDLKAPLSSVLGLIQIAKTEAQPAMLGTYLAMMEQSVSKLDGLVADLLALSRNKRTELVSEQIDWLHEINDCLSQLQYMNNFSQIAVSKDFKLHYAFHSDSKRIRILLNNLISNAIKYQKIPYEPYPSIEISIETAQDRAIIKIKDNGEGIRPDLQAKVFEMFYRASDRATGSGLGLYIAKSVAEKLGGNIHLDSVWQQGTTVMIVLPNWELRQSF